MITIRSLNKSYGTNHILKNINLHIEDGEMHAIVGKSGAGKSTLIKCINGSERYDSGELYVNHIEISQYTEEERRNSKKYIGTIFQNFGLITRKNVYDNIALPLKIWGYSKQRIDDRVNYLAKNVKIENKLNNYPSELSGGEKQRVGIARALSLKPALLLSDEATSSLDPGTGYAIMDLLKQINESLGVTIVVVSHQIELVKEYCETISIMEDGEIKATGSTNKMFLDKPEALSKLVSRSFNLTVEDNLIYYVLKIEDYTRTKKDLQKIFSIRNLPIILEYFGINESPDKNSGEIILSTSKENEALFSERLNCLNFNWRFYNGI